MAKTLREFGLQSDAAIGSPEATKFLLEMKSAGTPGALPVTPPTTTTTPPPAPTTTTPPITSNDMTTQPAPNFQTPAPTPPPDVSGLDSTFKLGKEEEKAQKEIIDIQEISNRLLGESAFKKEQEKAFGIEEQETALEDYKGQLRDLQRQEKAIPIQIQKEFEGRGVTAGGVAPIEAGRLRNNAIQALQVSSLIDASTRLLSSAEKKVERAVAAKYDPIKEELRVKGANLDLIIKSPQYDLETKKRAAQQKAIIDADKAKTEQDEKRTEAILKIATETAAELAKNGIAADTRTLNAIQKLSENPTPENLVAAQALASQEIAKVPQKVEGGEFEKAFFREKGRYPTTQEILDFKAREAAAGRKPEASGTTEQLYSGLSASTATAVRGRVAKFATEPTIQNFATIQEGYNFALSIPDNTKNPADDQALIYSLAKALDPGSVVREGEYATAQKYAQSWIKAYGKGVEQAILGTGFLSQEARKNIKQTIKQKYQASEKSYDNLYNQYAKGIGVLTGRQDGDQFLTEYKISPEVEAPKDIKEVQGGLDDDIKALGQSLGTREALIQELIRDYGKYITPDQIAKRVYTLIPDK